MEAFLIKKQEIKIKKLLTKKAALFKLKLLSSRRINYPSVVHNAAVTSR